MAEAAELEELELELEVEVLVEVLSLSEEDEEVLVEDDEEEVPVAVELEATPLAPALPVGDRPVAAEVRPVAARVDWAKVVAPVAEGTPTAELPAVLLSPPLARADKGETARRAKIASCLGPNILAVGLRFMGVIRLGD